MDYSTKSYARIYGENKLQRIWCHSALKSERKIGTSVQLLLDIKVMTYICNGSDLLLLKLFCLCAAIKCVPASGRGVGTR